MRRAAPPLADAEARSGTWRAEDGRVCYQFKTIPSACNDLRVAGKDVYLKRSNGQVVQLVPR